MPYHAHALPCPCLTVAMQTVSDSSGLGLGFDSGLDPHPHPHPHPHPNPNQVQQTVWDSSANQSRKLTGTVRFMPYKRQVRRCRCIRLQAPPHTVAGPTTYGCRPHHIWLQAAQDLDYELLSCIFAMLSYAAWG